MNDNPVDYTHFSQISETEPGVILMDLTGSDLLPVDRLILYSAAAGNTIAETAVKADLSPLELIIRYAQLVFWHERLQKEKKLRQWSKVSRQAWISISMAAGIGLAASCSLLADAIGWSEEILGIWVILFLINLIIGFVYHERAGRLS